MVDHGGITGCLGRSGRGECHRCLALVAEEFTGIGVMQPPERVIAFDLVRLAAGDIEGQRIAFGVRAEVILLEKPPRERPSAS